MPQIKTCELGFEREPLRHPFGFKGGYLSQLWQVVCCIQLDNGAKGIGTGVQSVLWSDAETFRSHTQTGGNTLMLAVTEYALTLLRGMAFSSPPAMLSAIADDVHTYACRITGRPNLPRTFSLNALVSVDFALWQLWAQEAGATAFDTLAEAFCPVLNQRQAALGAIPLIPYAMEESEIRAILDDGAFVLKIKIGSDPHGDQDLDAMWQWDAARLTQIHQLARDYDTPHTDCGHPVYYLDANGRYDSPERLWRFLDAVAPSGALDRVLLLEEPYQEDRLFPVQDIPVRVVGDESAHGADDAVRLIEQYGYGAIALKPVAKTLSVSFTILQKAQARGIPCFCADLTVPPLLLDWNMNVAARLAPLPGLKMGVLESNGPQNYRAWERLLDMHPVPHAPWLRPKHGVFELPDGFYARCAPFLTSPAYESILK